MTATVQNALTMDSSEREMTRSWVVTIDSSEIVSAA